ncbi:5-oxoprolinase subunit PxpA [Ascidiimonas sp. W6]|uniref:5-oxoprolinase subunit PxpA n=1 Tax=Ascidiimonas meishanensis TaxID=3128903 RepID=UPI0030EB8C96
MNLKPVDINCDVGEGVGNEAKILPLITRCNIACGGHAGDENSILEVMRLAKIYDVSIGAHPSYPDKENFGREVLVLGNRALKISLIAQLKLFKKCAKNVGLPVTHIKPHGALYNEALKSKKIAKVISKACIQVFPDAVLLAPFNSALAEVALSFGTRVMFEAFADRNYNNNLSMVSRKEANAVITNPESVLKHLLQMLEKGTVLTVTKKSIPMKAATFCIHGDTADALKILKFVKQKLPDYGWTIKK